MYKTIEKLCNEHNITIGKLCKEVGISSSTFTELKSGRTKTLSFKSASRVAEYFGVTVDFLYGNKKTSAKKGEGNMLTHKIFAVSNMDDAMRTVSKKRLSKWAELIDAIRDLPPEKIDMLIKMAESIK